VRLILGLLGRAIIESARCIHNKQLARGMPPLDVLIKGPLVRRDHPVFGGTIPCPKGPLIAFQIAIAFIASPRAANTRNICLLHAPVYANRHD